MRQLEVDHPLTVKATKPTIYPTDNYKKVYAISRQQNLDCRMYMDAKKLIDHKNYVMKNKKITEMEIEEMEEELQEDKRSHTNKGVAE
jgi:hypothetical protein